MKNLLLFLVITAALALTRANAGSFSFSTGLPDGRLATASQPGNNTPIEIESADDFVLANPTQITSATFTGLLPSGAPLSNIGQVVVEIYRVFPTDSDVGRTSGPPTFSTSQVPTRVNSPSDVAFDSRDSLATGELSVTENILNRSFNAANSIVNGINPIPNQLTHGEGPVSGEEVQFDVNFTKPFNLPADHYFFVPQVQVAGGNFLWLSTARPIVSPGTPFTPDLQAWIRNENLAPDWLREGTDIIGGTTFNEAFSLTGQTIPDSGSTALLLGCAIGTMAYLKRRICS